MDEKFLEQAIEQSRESVRQGAFPVGVILVADGQALATGISNGKQLNDPTSHAEIAAIREACATMQSRDLRKATLYSSMEPCLMCYGACYWASIRKVVYACGKAKLSPMHFEGQHDLAELNQQTRRPIEIIHLADMEDEALKVIQDWEAASVAPK